MNKTTTIWAIVCVVALTSMSLLAQVPLSNSIAAVGVLGQTDLVSNTAGLSTTKLDLPKGIALDPTTGKLFVADYNNRRVLRWSSVDKMTSGAAAEAVLGQPDFVTNTSGTSSTKMARPYGITVDAAGRLWVADLSNNRVLRFDNASTIASGSAANRVLGQPDFTTGTVNTGGISASTMAAPIGVFVDAGGRLWVAERDNKRILRFDNAASKSSGDPADGVLGEPDFATNTGGLSASLVTRAYGVVVDGNGSLWVADRDNNRVLRFDSAATKLNGAAANGVLGQVALDSNVAARTQSGQEGPRGIFMDASGRLYVSDEANNRILVYMKAASKANGANADVVIGQADFTSYVTPNPPTASSVNYPEFLVVDDAKNQIWLADEYNNRILRFDLGPKLAVGVLGQTDFVSNALGLSTTKVDMPKGIALDPTTGKLFVADYNNRRVLRWSSVDKMTDGAAAEAVLGQPDFVTNTSGTSSTKMARPYGITVDAAGRLWVADLSNNRVLRFDNASTIASGSAANRVLGQPDFTTGTVNTGGISALTMSAPIGVFVDGAGRLWVAERDNKRILRFDNAASKSSGDPADGVLGEPNFTTNAGGLSAALVTRAYGITGDANGRIWVGDRDNNRVLRFDSAATKANGADASAVIGQVDFVSNVAARTQSGVEGPRGVFFSASGKLYVVDEANNRITVYDSAATRGNGPMASDLLGQTDFLTATNPNPPTAGSLNYPEFLVVDDVNKFIWLADEYSHRILRLNEGSAPVLVANFAVAPKSIAYGTVVVNTTKKDSVTVTNSGTAALVIDSVKSDNGQFTITPASASVPASGTLKFYINFTPTTVGAKSGNVLFYHKAASQKDTVVVNGTGAQASFVVAPKAVSFGGVLSTQTKKDSVVVTNTGTVVLQIDSVRSDNAMYTVTPSGVTSIPASGTQKFYINFTPTSVGVKTGNVLFYHNAANKKDTVTVNGTGVVGAFFTEDFTSASGTLLTAAGWTQSGTTTTNPIAITTPGLSIGKYSGNGVGNAATLMATGQDVYQSFPSINQGSVYFSMMLRVDTAGTGDYFAALSPTSSQTNYYARLHVKNSGAGYTVGINKSNEVTGGAQYGTTVLTFKTTYLVVVKYTFVGTAVDTTNDPISVYVFSSTIPTTEPGTPEINAYVASSKNDAVNLGYVTLRQGTTGAAAGLVIDGFRIGTSWTTGVPTGVVEQKADIPQTFALQNNYPNPFNPSTTISYALPQASRVHVKIYSVLGQEVRTLVNTEQNANYYIVTWNGRDNYGNSVSSGVYFIRMVAEPVNSGGQPFVQVKKMNLMK
jgi:sugar lactone lactonase YvrE